MTSITNITEMVAYLRTAGPAYRLDVERLAAASGTYATDLALINTIRTARIYGDTETAIKAERLVSVDLDD